MKKVYLFLLSFCVYLSTQASIVEIQVVNNQFNPANANVNVGDVVRFIFTEMNHNATSNGVPNALPAGAAAIHSGFVGATAVYDYTVTQPGTYKYVCEAHADPSTFTGMVGQFDATPMPALMKEFLVSVSPDKKPLISWVTLNENNVKHFSVRRSLDGINFKETGVVNSDGNSVSEKSYNYIDHSAPGDSKYIYYHLAIVDRDGSVKLTEIKMFRNPNSSTKLITQLGPNPISKPNQLMVYFNADKNSFIDVRAFDATGRMVLETRMQAFPGINNGHIHVCDFQPGTYTFQFTMDGVKETRRVIVN